MLYMGKENPYLNDLVFFIIHISECTSDGFTKGFVNMGKYEIGVLDSETTGISLQ